MNGVLKIADKEFYSKLRYITPFDKLSITAQDNAEHYSTNAIFNQSFVRSN